MERAKIPATLPDDESLVRVIRERYGDAGWLFIPNTLHLDTMYATPDLAEQLRGIATCEVVGEPATLRFEQGRHTLRFA
jgi:hypothetical protein